MAEKKVNTVSFEYSYKKLQKILDELEKNINEKSLDEVIANYQEGLKLLKICRDQLKSAELKIEEINKEI